MFYSIFSNLFQSIVVATDHAGLHTRVSSEKLIVDITPPIVGRIFLKTETVSNWISDGILTIQILDFSDEESGIDKYMVHVGSSKYKMDILSQSDHAGDMIQLSLQGTDVMDGHFYYLGLKVRRYLYDNRVFGINEFSNLSKMLELIKFSSAYLYLFLKKIKLESAWKLKCIFKMMLTVLKCWHL